jgi:PTS system N-acetylglucosamine-specific IIC component
MRLNIPEMLQPIGRALMLPIAVLPVAGMLLRLGQPDLLNIAFVTAAGDAIFANLGLLFGIGVAVGLARENNGAAGLAGAVCFLVTTEGAKALLGTPPDISAISDATVRNLTATAWKSAQIAKLSVPAGILAGLVSGLLYNRYASIRFPEYLAFFGGRRFVPIAAGGAGILGALLFGYGFPVLEGGIDGLSHAVLNLGPAGLFLFGMLNRLLIITGMHHILNNIAWFLLGDYHGVTGDLKRFFAGDPTAGAFMAGFFPVTMFGLPAACLAMYHSALPGRRAEVGGLLLSLALTSFLTGVTEPIEFTFLFLAPALFALHAVLTGIAMVVMDMIGARLGFGFSAGLFDYVLDFGLATRPLLLLPVGAVYALLYYGSFRFGIVRFNLKTPGRDNDAGAPVEQSLGPPIGDTGNAFVLALGGAENITTVDACTTRLRLVIADNAKVNEPALRGLGARGFVRPGAKSLQVVMGPDADRIADEIRQALARLGTEATPTIAHFSAIGAERTISPDIAAALGGEVNIQSFATHGNRLCVTLVEPAAATMQIPAGSGLRGIARPARNTVQIIFDPATELR